MHADCPVELVYVPVAHGVHVVPRTVCGIGRRGACAGDTIPGVAFLESCARCCGRASVRIVLKVSTEAIVNVRVGTRRARCFHVLSRRHRFALALRL